MSIEASEAIKKVSKIHLLVHPGFTSNDLRHTLAAGIEPEDELPSRAFESEKLLKRIEEYAKAIPEDEIMVALTDSRREELVSKEIPYVQTLKALREILKRRLIVFSDYRFDSTSPNTNKEQYAAFENIAEKRGFRITKDTPIEAYGETEHACVKDALAAFKETGAFTGTASINSLLTNDSFE